METELPFYRVNGRDYCKDCIKEYILDNFEDLVLNNEEALEAMDIEREDGTDCD